MERAFDPTGTQWGIAGMTEATADAHGNTAFRTGSKGPRRRGRVPRAPSYVFWMVIVYLVMEFIRPELLTPLKLQYIVGLLIPLLWLRERRRQWSVALTVQALFVVWCAQAVPFASNNFSAYMVTRTGLTFLVTGIALTWVGSNFRDLKRVIWFWVALMVYQGVWAITHGGRGTGGFLGDENDAALVGPQSPSRSSVRRACGAEHVGAVRSRWSP